MDLNSGKLYGPLRNSGELARPPEPCSAEALQFVSPEEGALHESLGSSDRSIPQKRNPEPARTHRRADPRRLDDKSLWPPGPRLWTRIAPSGRGLRILCNRITLLSAATVKGRDRCIILVVPDIHSNPGAAISTTITTTLDRRPHHRLPPYPHRPVVVVLPALQTSQYLYS